MVQRLEVREVFGDPPLENRGTWRHPADENQVGSRVAIGTGLHARHSLKKITPFGIELV